MIHTLGLLMNDEYLANINWDKFLEDLNEVPEIANLIINACYAPPFMYVMLAPDVPYAVIERLLEINPKAVNYEQLMQDVNNWMNIVAVWYNAQKKDSWLIEEIHPKSLRLIMETTTKYDLAFIGDLDGFVPIERFVN